MVTGWEDRAALALLATVVIAAAGIAWLRRTINPHGDPEIAAYLRHPIHPTRCACRRYGLPGIDGVRDEQGTHTITNCPPEEGATDAAD